MIGFKVSFDKLMVYDLPYPTCPTPYSVIKAGPNSPLGKKLAHILPPFA